MLRVREIRPRERDCYEVILEGASGTTETILCRIVKIKGIAAVSMNPDLVMGREPPRIDSRDVSNAVLTFHRHQSGLA